MVRRHGLRPVTGRGLPSSRWSHRSGPWSRRRAAPCCSPRCSPRARATPEGEAAPTASRATPSGSGPSSAGTGARERPVNDHVAAALAPALEGEPAPPRSPREAASQIEAADRAVQDPATRPAVVSAAGHTQQLAYRAVADRPGWDRRVSELLPGALRATTAGQRRGPPGVPLDAPDARRRPRHRAARVAHRRPPAGRRAAALLPRGGAPLRRRLGVPRRDQPGRDRVRPDRGHLGRRRAGTDAVHPHHVGHLRRGRRHRATRTTRSSPPAGCSAPTASRATGPARCCHYNNSSAYVRGSPCTPR